MTEEAAEVNVEVEVEAPPTPEPEPEPVPIPVPVPTPEPASDGYREEHNVRHEGLDETLAEIRSKLEEHDGLHRSHDESISSVHNRISDLEGKLVEPIKPEPSPEPEPEPEPESILDEPTIIPPDIPETEVTQQNTHWLRRIGF